MSEHYDFHYQPTGSGAISGQQVLQQTEDAINELGDYVNDNVGGAMDVAQQALETAQNAETNAQTALDTANSFSSAIQSAQQDASTALSTAQSAGTTAGNAINLATTASQDASSAVTTANNASGQVSTLSGTVTALGQRVTTAEGNIGQNTSDITALTTRVGTAEGNITTLQNDVSIAQGNASSAMATAGQVKQQAFVFRYSSTALVASSTNSNTLLDNTDNLKVGDKVIDSSGVLFSVTAIDTVNSTFTIGSALVDLALDANVVHTSGNETIGGKKTFTNDVTVNNSNASVQADVPNLLLKNPLVERASTTLEGEQTILFTDKNNSNIASIQAKTYTSGTSDIILTSYGEYNGVKTTGIVIRRTPTTSKLHGYSDNITSLGDTNRRWSKVYAMSYYYGNDNVEFSTKFVTTDTAQTISGAKTFSDNFTIYNSDDTVTPKGLAIRNAQWVMGESGVTTVSNINFLDKNSAIPASIIASKGISGQSYLRFAVRTKDSQNNTYSEEIYYNVDTLGNVSFRPWHDDIISLGTSAYKWKGVYATNYYYGSNNIEFSTKFVTTDTNQTISGAKTFSEDVVIGNSDTTQNSKRLVLRSYKASLSGSNSDNWGINFNAGASYAVAINAHKSTDGAQGLVYTVRTQDSNNNIFTSSYRFRVFIDGNSVLEPDVDNNVSLGRSTNRWKNTCTCLINGLEPSSLSLPSDRSARIDISSYITNLGNGDTNAYTVPANGYIWLHFTSINSALCYSQTSGGLTNYAQTFVRYQGDGQLYAFFPVRKDDNFVVQIYTSSTAVVQNAYFIPCQGNV